VSLDILQNIERRWNAGSQAWDPSKLASIYAENAVFFGGRRNHAVERLQIEKYFRSYASVLRGLSVSFVEQEVRDLSRSAFLAQGFGNFSFEFCDGRRSLNRLRTTLVITMEDNEGQVLLHHFSSVPEEPPLGIG